MEARSLVRHTLLLCFCAALLAGPGTASAVAAPQSDRWHPGAERFGVVEQRNVAVTMRDGTEIRANVLRPADPATGHAARGRFPVLINFTPYGKLALDGIGALPASGDGAGLARPVPELVRRGYVNVVADIRGTGNSGGRFGLLDPVQGRDGADLVRWAASIPGSNGRVGMYGPSYMGIIQYLTVSHLGRRSPLKAMLPIVTPNDPYRELLTAGGMLSALTDVPLFAVFIGLPVLWPLLDDSLTDPLRAIELELGRTGSLIEEIAPLGIEILSGGERSYRGSYWRRRSPGSHLARVVRNRVPVMSVGGWHDVFQRGSLMNWAGLQSLEAGHGVARKPGRGLRPSPRHHVVQGPWNHLNGGAGFPLGELAQRWFDTHLKRRGSTGLGDPTRTVHLFDLGAERWRDVRRYPVPQAKLRSYYLSGGPGAGAPSRNDGALSRRPPREPAGEDEISFVGVSNPCGKSADQYSLGGLSLLLSPLGLEVPCNRDDSQIQSGPGALTYTTPPMGRPTTIAGPIAARIFMRSSRPETYLVATVQDVAPDGTSRPLTQGALLGSFRELNRKRSWFERGRGPLLPHHRYTRDSSRDVPPGQVTRFDIEVFPTFATIRRGHRLRLTLASIDTPHTLPTPSQATRLLGGVYHVQRNAARSSYVNVPMAPASSFRRGCRICRPAADR